MVKERSQEREIQRSLELGRENARLYPKVKNWCRHLQVNMTSSGLLAAQSGLPIGSMEITCEHASAGGIQAMQLRSVATTFIVENCRGCTFHELVDLDNVGSLILKDWEEIQSERQSKAQIKESSRTRIKELVSGDLTEALNNENITKQSIIKLVVLLEDPKHHIEAAENILQASEIAPELFSEIAIEVICSYFPDYPLGAYCIKSIRQIAKHTGKIPEKAIIAASHCLAEHKNSDEACTLFGDYIVQTNSIPEPEVIDAIVGTQYHGHFDIRPNAPYHEHKGSNYALKEIGTRDLDALINVLKNRLTINQKETRFNVAHVIQNFIDVFPDLALRMIDLLIDSLELDDDIYNGTSADGAARNTLAEIYILYPDETQEKIEQGYQRASSEAKTILYSVYDRIARNTIRRTQPLDSRYQTCLIRITPILLGTIGGLGYPLEVKSEAADTLDVISRYHARILVSHIDTLIGTLANLTLEDSFLAEKKPKNLLEELNNSTDRTVLGGIIKKVVGAVEAICNIEPNEVLKRLKEIAPKLDSKINHEAAYKGELAELFGYLGTRNEFTPEVIPELYKLLMDFDSVLVRGSAVQAIGKILEKGIEALPENMLEMLIHYLSDPYVFIHKTATRVMRYVRPKDMEAALNIAYRLLNLDRAYEKDPYFREEIAKALINLSYKYTELLPLTAQLLVKHCQLSEFYVAQNSLEAFSRLLPHLPVKYIEIFAREVLAFLGRTEREHFNDETNTERYELYLSLYDLPREAIFANLNILQETARNKAKEDTWDALRMVELLSYFEFHLEAAQLAQEILSLLPKTKRYESVILRTTVIGAVTKAESLVAEGKAEQAAQLLEEVTALEAQDNAKTSNIDEFIETHILAERIADRLKRI